MNDNTFWFLFWVIVTIGVSFNSYMKYKSVSIEQETQVKIAKIKEESNKHLTESYEKLYKKLLELQ